MVYHALPLHPPHRLGSPGRVQETRPSSSPRSLQATTLHTHSQDPRLDWGCTKHCSSYALLTCFVFDKNVKHLIHSYFERFVFDVFGLIWGYTSVGLCDKWLGHITAAVLSPIAPDLILAGHDDDAMVNTQSYFSSADIQFVVQSEIKTFSCLFIRKWELSNAY